jgi:RNA polymerase sigma-70 factor (ECF subfamily)
MQGAALVEMVARLHEGSPESWGVLLAQLAPRLIGYFERLGIDHHLAEDLTQEVLATVYRKLDDLRDPTRFEAWLRSIARNRLRSRLRRARFTEILDEESLECRDGLGQVYDQDLRRVVLEEVRRFGPGVRRMLELRLLEDRTPSEISRLMGIPSDLFRRRFHVALKALRRRIAARMTGGIRSIRDRSPVAPTLPPRRSHSHRAWMA